MYFVSFSICLFSFFNLINSLIGGKLLYNVVLVSAVQFSSDQSLSCVQLFATP